MKTKKTTRKLFIIIVFSLLAGKIFSQDNETAGFEIRYFYDDFGDKTNIPYLYKSIEGKFSNIATTDSKLNVDIIISNIELGFGLIEYGSSRVKNNDTYVINFKDLNGNVYNILADSVPELTRIPMSMLSLSS